MYRIAIVEDDLDCAESLMGYLKRYGAEKALELELKHFKNAVYFLEEYRPDFDLVLMDIQMPYLNGMDAAHKLREIDQQVLLIFVTSMAQYAIKGYEVNAFDYILKPVSCHDFSLKMARAMRRLGSSREPLQIVLDTTQGKRRLPLQEIRYIETKDHHLLYHVGGPGQEQIYTQYATMSSIIEKMSAYDFARCNSYYLVNLRYVQGIKGYLVTVDGQELQISQSRKKGFVKSFMDYAERNLK